MKQLRRSGFTLVELMVVLSVAAVLMSLAVPNLRSFILNNRLSAGVNDLLRSFNLARTEAIKRQANVVVCGTANLSGVADAQLRCDYRTFKGWFVFVDNSPATGGNWQHEADEPVLERHDLLDTSMTVRTDAGSDIASYGPSGFENLAPAVGLAPTSALVLCDSRGVQQLGAGGAAPTTARAFLVTSTGRARASATWNDVAVVALPLVGGACP